MEKINEAGREAELEAEVTRLRGFLVTCRAEVMRVAQLLAAAEERAVETVKVYEAIDKLTAAKVQAARLEKKMEAEMQP